MYRFLVVLLVLDSVLLVGAVLVQSGKGGGLAASFGGASSSTDAFVGTRQAANLFTKTTWWSAGVFLTLALFLSIMSGRNRVPSSVLDPLARQQPSRSTAPITSPSGAAPAVPLTPANPAPAVPAPGSKAPTSKAPATTVPPAKTPPQ